MLFDRNNDRRFQTYIQNVLGKNKGQKREKGGKKEDKKEAKRIRKYVRACECISSNEINPQFLKPTRLKNDRNVTDPHVRSRSYYY